MDYWAITAHVFSHVNSSTSLQKIKQFQWILTFYAKVKKDTTQDKKDILGTKGTKQGHSGHKGRIAPFWLCVFLWARVEFRVEHARVAKQNTSHAWYMKPK